MQRSSGARSNRLRQDVRSLLFPLPRGVAMPAKPAVFLPYRMPVVVQVGSPETTIALAQVAQTMTTPTDGSAVDTGG